jgi:PKD repeat protein
LGDGTNSTTADPTVSHIYATPGEYEVKLTCIADGLVSSTATKTIDVLPNNIPTIDVTGDVGKTHFRGETADFGILVSSHGEAVNATKIEALLYHDDILAANLTGSVKAVTTGLYTIPYNIPVNAETGTYRMIVQAEYYNAKGNCIASFQISPTLTAWDGQITEIQNGVATVSNGITNLTLNLTAVNATLAGLIENNGQVLAKIDTTAGTLTTQLTTINATITAVEGNTVTVSTTLGDVKTKLDGLQSTATTTLYAASIISAIAVILAIAILIYVRKK